MGYIRQCLAPCASRYDTYTQGLIIKLSELEFELMKAKNENDSEKIDALTIQIRELKGEIRGNLSN